MSAAPATYDVVVIGGGPAGSSTATFLADGGLRVGLFEREAFPRFHIGESLMPATMVLLEQLGAREAVEASGFQIKYGAMFYEQSSAKSQTYYFLPGQPWPNYAYQVLRSRFDAVLLDNARKHGVTVHQPARVESAAFDASGVTITATSEAATLAARAAMVVDATGRDGFLTARFGRRRRIPNLGKVALFAHHRGAARWHGREEGNIRVYVFDDGWFWWIPLADDVTSVGAVLHARTVRGRPETPERLYEAMIQRCHEVAKGLVGAERITPVHCAANFAYVNSPVVGDRFVCVGDAITFVDPIFSGGVFIALRTGQWAAEAILEAFHDGRFTARRFRRYERRVQHGVRPLFRFIHKYYEPTFFDLLMTPRNYFGVYDAVLNVLSGGSFIRFPWRARLALQLLFAIARFNTWTRRLSGRPVESRLEW